MNIRIIIFPIIFLALSSELRAQDRMDLSGEWAFQIDADDQGEQQQWYQQLLSESISLPGSMATNGKGEEVGIQTQWTGGIRNPDWFHDSVYAPYTSKENFRIPFWLQPVKKYTGPAWYQKKVKISEDWKNKAIMLHLERCHWQTTVWVDSQQISSQNSLSTPHEYDLTSYLAPGDHTITIRVDNRTDQVDVGENSHSISDHTQSNWNGIVGGIYLEGKAPVYLSEFQLYPSASSHSLTIKGNVVSKSEKESTLQVEAQVSGKGFATDIPAKTFNVTIPQGQQSVEWEIPLGSEVKYWDEFSPQLYQLSIKTSEGDQYTEDFGFREITFKDRQLLINGRPTFLRGTLECAIFPETGYPNTDLASWKEILGKIQAYGLNHIRFHSWCPPEAAFVAADSMGVYLQIEAASWANQSTTLGDGKPVDQYVQQESERIVQTYGNHPSFVMMAYGNEPGGEHYTSFLTDFVCDWKDKDPRRIYTSGAGWPDIPVNQYHVLPQPRIQGWGEELNSIINSQAPSTNYDWNKKMPDDTIAVVSHEIGQWCVYPDFREIDHYTGVLKAKNFEIFQESLTDHGMAELSEDFLLASGKLQALCYKADIEAALRTTNQAGFQLLDLHDFPGQGTALVGVLNPFWEEKGYITADEYSRFCSATVPLVRVDKRIFVEGETMNAQVEVAHFGKEAYSQVTPTWTLKDTDGATIADGQLSAQDIAIGNGIALGSLSYKFKELNQPRKLILEVSIEENSNIWDIWVYPETSGDLNSQSMRHVTSMDSSTMQYLKEGGTVLLSLGKGKVAKDMGGDVGVGFSSIFWNTAWTDNQKPHTLGILCDPQHPALEAFPTEFHSNWQWWDAMSHSDAIMLPTLGKDLQPIVRVIDDWVTNRNLGLIVEGKVGNGKILISGIDLKDNLENRPEARQLLFSLTQYMESDAFNPQVSLDPAQVSRIQLQ